MAQSKFDEIDKEEFKKIYKDVKNYRYLNDIAIHYNVDSKSIKRWADKLKLPNRKIASDKIEAVNKFTKKMERLDAENQNLKNKVKELEKAPPLSFEDRVEVKKLKEEISSLNKDIREAEKQAMTSEHLKKYIHGSENHDFGKVPEWLTPKKSSNRTNGIPCLFLSDIHFDEYVDPAQINYVNDFNRDIAVKRLQHTFNTSIDILFNRTKNPKYDGFVLALGGDLLSGNIHEELAETNEDSIMRSLLTLTDILIDGIELHLKYFKKIFIPCVVGNHGRLHKKPRAKNKVYDNYEWLIYQFIARHFKDDKRVELLIPDGPDAHFRIYNKGFLLTHGDQFRGGNAIAGIFSPLMLGFHRKQKKQSSINQSFDVMMLGHFHQYVHTNQLVINGSVKGYDEYANNMNFPAERPQQALFINHPTNGMVLRTPILCDSYKEVEQDKEKIVVFK